MCVHMCVCFVWHSLCSCANYITEGVQLIREVGEEKLLYGKKLAFCWAVVKIPSIYTHPSPYLLFFLILNIGTNLCLSVFACLIHTMRVIQYSSGDILTPK